MGFPEDLRRKQKNLAAVRNVPYPLTSSSFTEKAIQRSAVGWRPESNPRDIHTTVTRVQTIVVPLSVGGPISFE